MLFGLNAYETVRVVSKRAILRQSHLYTHAHLSTWCDTSYDHRGSNACDTNYDHRGSNPCDTSYDHRESNAGGQPRYRECYHWATGRLPCQRTQLRWICHCSLSALCNRISGEHHRRLLFVQSVTPTGGIHRWFRFLFGWNVSRKIISYFSKNSNKKKYKNTPNFLFNKNMVGWTLPWNHHNGGLFFVSLCACALSLSPPASSSLLSGKGGSTN